jgi:POT family proton-dependent oligopeptide transporter
MAGLQIDSAIPALAEADTHDAYERKGADTSSVSAASDRILNDGVHDGLVFPTDDERATLRRVPDSIPINAYCTSPCARHVRAH